MARMNKLLLLIAVVASACSASPTAPQPSPTPTPIPKAALAFVGSLSFSNCQAVGDVIACDFSGGAQNTGDGCALNVRGTTTTYRPKPSEALIDTTQWIYGVLVRAGERFTYSGRVKVVAEAGSYVTEFVWDNTRCP